MKFTFIDLFAGIGGIRKAFEKHGGECVFSSEWNKYSCMTYKSNYHETPAGDITQIPAEDILPFDVLCAGFPCQPFSIAGVSKKNSMGRKHGFEDREQGNLFFEIVRIVKHHQPELLFLENVKNLLSHDRGNTFQIIKAALINLGYQVDVNVFDAANFVPQHRERTIIVASKTKKIVLPRVLSKKNCKVSDILEKNVDPKYTLSDKLWNFLQEYAKKHREKGNGFGFGLADLNGVTRTLSARYYKDGSDILIPQTGKNPRRLTPRECARLQGYPDSFVIPVSDTQAYKQFGNSVCVPMMEYLSKIVLDQSGLLDNKHFKRRPSPSCTTSADNLGAAETWSRGYGLYEHRNPQMPFLLPAHAANRQSRNLAASSRVHI
ncbi:MAG: DNA (cytosine-5-)-methyltransferase [Candidatus Peregrinibacteria bacterium]